MTDPYATLGVQRGATPNEITGAYRKQLRAHHPDTRADASNPGADERLSEILAAYALLRDPHRRAEYDRSARAAAPARLAVVRTRRTDSARGAPLLWAGPVRWHPSR